MSNVNMQTQGVKRPNSGKKTKKETIKQVLASPFAPYWPLISNEDCKTLQDAFNECLPIIEQNKIEKPHWKILKEMPKEQRKQQFQQSNKAVKKDYAFGVNEVTKSLEKSTIHAVLIASDVSPRLLVKHVIDMCVIKNLPVLVVPELRQILLQRAGVTGVVFGVKNNNLLTQTIKDIHMNYPVPEDHIHYFRSLKCEEADFKVNEAVPVEDAAMEETEEQDLYLYRSSTKERVFKPETSQSSVAIVAAPLKQEHSFLSLEEKTAQKPNYRALIVKRLKGNKNREKRKREIVKHNKSK